MQRQLRLSAVLFLSLFLLCFSSINPAQAQRLVRVGCFPMQSLERDAEIPGLSVYEKAYLQELIKYVPWKYEFIYFPSWQQAVEALENGGIDLMGFAQKTPERQAKFSYSEFATNITYEALFAPKTSGYMFEDFAQFQDKRIGILENYICRADFENYMRQNHFTARLIPYKSVFELWTAMKNGQIDLLVSNIDDRSEWEEPVGRFTPSPMFYITNKKNKQLLNELNYAESEIRRRTPEFLLHLNELHFPKHGRVFLKKRDLDYVKEHPVVTIGLLTHRAPLYSLNPHTGKMEGIMIDLLEHIAAHTGLKFNYLPIENGSPLQFLKEGKADIAAGLLASKSNLADRGLLLSETILECNLGMIGRKTEVFDPTQSLTIAVPRTFKACQEYIEETYPHFKLFLCDNTFSGLNAVKDGRADFLVQNSYVLSHVMQLPLYRDLTVVPTISIPENLKLGMLASTDPRLVSLLNTSIVSIPPEKIAQFVINHMMQRETLSFQDLYLGYKFQIIAVFILVLTIIGGALYIFQMRHRHLHQIERREKILKNITNNITGGVITLVADENFTITYANDGFIDLIGYKKRDYEKKQRQIGLSYIHEEDRPRLLNLLRENHDAEKLEFEFRIVRKDGGIVPSLFRGTAARDDNGKLFYYCVVIDISLQKKMMRQIETEKERYRIITEQSDSIIFEIDFKKRSITFSHKFEEQFGVDASGDLSALNLHPNDIPILEKTLDALTSGQPFVKAEIRLQKSDGAYLWCEMQASPIRKVKDDFVGGAVGKIMDINDEKNEKEKLKTLSQTDPLTGLYNKTTTYASIEAFLRSDSPHVSSALIFVDIDNFKGINDYFGHMKGDEVLLEITEKLRSAFRPDDIIGRFGGDEFCIFTPQISRPDLEALLEKLRLSICKTYSDNINAVHVSSSIGVAFFPEDAAGISDLIKKADKSLYAAKERGKNQVIFYEEDLVLRGYKNERK